MNAHGTGGDWALLAELLRRLARGDVGAIEDLAALADPEHGQPEVAEAAENLGLILVKMEGLDFLLSTADEVESRLRALNELKNRHLGVAAHDLRNPLGTIRGLAGLVAKGELPDEKQRLYASSIVRISDEMLVLLENLLDVALIESGHLELNLATGNLAALSEERGDRAASAGKQKGIGVTSRVAEVPDTVFDPVRMGQVLDNLLSNALKFSPPESSVEVGCELRGDVILIAVRDRGPGIPAEELGGIFDAYRRATVRPTAGEKSTGLGLSTAKPVVEAHGGSIEVESVVGEGTTFIIRMPVSLPPAQG